MRPSWIAGALTVGVVFGAYGCSAKEAPPATVAKPNVLLIAVDTLRADRLDCYGNTRELTPSIDRLAAEGVRFDQCFAHAPWTLPSFASLFSSLDPEQHGAGGSAPAFLGLRETIPTLPKSFRQAGYRTMAVVNVDFLSQPFGLMRGFEESSSVAYENNAEMRDARRTTDAALHWLEGHRSESFFLFVHYFDPHAEYRPPPEFRAKFAAEVDRHNDAFVFGTREQVGAVRAGLIHLKSEDVARAEKLYDGEVAFTDREIGRLLDAVSHWGLDETTLVVFTADHGEEFLDHGGWEHGHTLYDELLHVPLVVRQKGRIVPRVVKEPVGLVDVAPTLCAHCAIPRPASFIGRDLAPLSRGETIEPAVELAYGNFWGPALISLRDPEFKLILTPATKGAPAKRELYRWREDPHELSDVHESAPEVVERLTAELARLDAERVRTGYGPGPRVSLSESEKKRLNQLGYTGEEKH
jgi:arylsulfatase A-like enzyme